MDDDEQEFGDDVKIAKDGLPAREAGIWAKRKLEFLQEYIHRFTVGMKPSDKKRYNWKGLVYIDLFAGPGKCVIRGTQKEVDGSPLIAREAPWKFSQMYFVERDPVLCAALRTRLGQEANVSIFNEDCNTAVLKIAAQARRDHLYLAFIDPTGLNIKFDTLKLLASKLRCDLIINWYMSSIKRNIPQFKRKGSSLLFDEFFGTSEWSKHWDEANLRRTTDKLRVLYQTQLESIGYSYQAEPEVMKNNKNAEMYWLWFASKDKLGLKFWKSSKRTTDPQGELF